MSGGGDLAQYQGFLDVRTGELLEPSVAAAVRCIHSARAMKQQVNEIVNEATAYLVEEGTRQGTKTLHGGDETVTVSGGPTVDYDPDELIRRLFDAGCPSNRVEAAVCPVVTYKVDRGVLRQLAAANPVYAKAIRSSELEVENPYRASIKLRRNTDAD